ncbi:hypothetical protein HYPSUDRAFT_79066 [Hypholoma sublateritium FD-334 SS-4]|uniref:Uncharacterized protein n=1 Tax=Hypholoma sublateritium (strain FD-334 SS-4) TaxID=945553 RepID=A0A0D2PER6_HYPSF|nr:hypothetical protein HYPSUDRAFT_79066 [Hypholoma sublateritium FD-334 SS-4]
MRQGNGVLQSGSSLEDNLESIPGAAVLRSPKSKSFRSSPLAGPAISVAVADQPSTESRRASSYISSATPLADPLHSYPRTRSSQSISRSVFLRRLSQPLLLGDKSPSEPNLFSTRPANVAPTGSSVTLHAITENEDVGGQRVTSLKREVTPLVFPGTSNGSAIAHQSAAQPESAVQLRMGERTTMDVRMRNSASGSRVRSESPTQSGSITAPARPKSITPPHRSPVARTPPKDNSWYTEHAYTTTPRFSRLGLPAEGVVLPLTAKEYKKKNGNVSRHSSQSMSKRSTSKAIEEAPPSEQGSRPPSSTRRLLPSIPHILLTPIIRPRRSQKLPTDADCVGRLPVAVPAPAPELQSSAILPSSPTNSEHSTLFMYDSIDPVDVSPSSGTASSASSTLADESRPPLRDTDKFNNSPSGSDIFRDDVLQLSFPKPAGAPERSTSIMSRIRCLRWTSRARRTTTQPSREVD